MDLEEFTKRIVAIAKHKYELEEEVTLSCMWEIEQCFENGFSPIRTVEVIADHIF